MKNLTLIVSYCAFLSAMIFCSPGQASAAWHTLTSAPLSTGATGSFICTCVNVCKKDLELGLGIKSDAGIVFDSGGLEIIHPGNMIHLTSKPGVDVEFGTPAYCSVSQSNQKQLTTKQVDCTFSSVDVNGSPQVVVPVDNKFRHN